MTQGEFNKLPGLLQRKEFQKITGLSDKDLDCMTITSNQLTEEEIDRLRRNNLLPVFRPHGRDGYAKYYKADAARIAGFKL